MIALGETQRRWAKRIGYPLLGLIVFVFAVHYTFPYGRIEEKLSAWAGENYDVTVDSIEPGWLPGNVVMKGVTFRSRPKPGEKATEFVIDELDLDISLLSAITGTYDIEIEGAVGDGKFTGHVVTSKKETKISFHSADMPLDNLPGVRSGTGGVPIKGGLTADVSITLAKGKWKEANGEITLACAACTVGDGKAKIKPMAQGQKNAFSSEGMTLPKLKLGKIGGKIEIAKGVGRFVDFKADSPDGELTLEGDIRFEDPFSRSQVTAYMRFKSSDDLKKREPTMDDMEKFMGAQARRPDGYMGVSITGPIAQLRYLGAKTSPVPTRDKAGKAAKKETLSKPDRGEGGRPPNINVPPPDQGEGKQAEPAGAINGNVQPTGAVPSEVRPVEGVGREVPGPDEVKQPAVVAPLGTERGAEGDRGGSAGTEQEPPPPQPVIDPPPEAHDTDPDQPPPPPPPPAEEERQVPQPIE